MDKHTLKNAFTDTLPVMAGYVFLGMGFGIVLNSIGYGVLWSFAMSFFIYAGSMQYAAIGLITSGASFVTAAVTTLMVNARHIFYGISVLEKYKKLDRKVKPYAIFALTDETYSLVATKDEGEDKRKWSAYCLAVSVFDQFYWVAGSVIGSLIGSAVTFNAEGIDFALTALFVTIATENWLTNKEHFPALTGFAATAVCLLLFGKDNFLIPAMLVISAVLLISQKLKKKAERGGENE